MSSKYRMYGIMTQVS